MQGETFIFFGIVGSGKGTQIGLLRDYLKQKGAQESVYAYPGGEYRQLIESGNYVGTLIKDSMNRGELQPDFLTTSIVTNILTTSLEPKKNLFFDGYPRTISQAESLESMVKFFGREKINIVYIKLREEEAMKRNLLRGRSDDTPEGIKKRFEEYMNNVIPAMNYFQGKSGFIIHTINGERPIEEVHQNIIQVLNL